MLGAGNIAVSKTDPSLVALTASGRDRQSAREMSEMRSGSGYREKQSTGMENVGCDFFLWGV